MKGLAVGILVLVLALLLAHYNLWGLLLLLAVGFIATGVLMALASSVRQRGVEMDRAVARIRADASIDHTRKAGHGAR